MDAAILSAILADDLPAVPAIASLLTGFEAVLFTMTQQLVRLARQTENEPQLGQRKLPEELASGGAATLAGPAGERDAIHDETVWRARIAQLGELTAAIAHELRQPLAAMALSAQAARHYSSPTLSRRALVGELLDDIIQAGRQADAVVQRLQGLLRREPVRQGPVDLNEVVTLTLVSLQRELVLSGAGCRVQLQENLPRVSGDPVQLGQVVAHLVVNACDAMASAPAAERLVMVRTWRGSAGEACLAVGDRGMGLAPEVRDTLFQPVPTAKSGRLGLGLAYCRTIAVAHGGTIAGENHPDGPGSVFTLTLPAPVPAPESSPHDPAEHHIYRG